MNKQMNQTISTLRNYPEVDNIKEDARSLKENTKELAQHVYADGKEAVSEASGFASRKLSSLRETSKEELLRAEDFVRANPGRSVAYAFLGGIIASLLFKK